MGFGLRGLSQDLDMNGYDDSLTCNNIRQALHIWLHYLIHFL